MCNGIHIDLLYTIKQKYLRIMSLHKCPSCKEIGLNWRVDDEISELTIWDCWECGYQAFENESYVSQCPDCGYAYRILIKDDYTNYWWCSNCEKKTIENELEL